MENSLKGLMLGASVIITCIVLSTGFLFARESQALSASSTEKLNDFTVELSETDMTLYDGLEVTGSDVVNFIKKRLGEYTSSETAPIFVSVKTAKAENRYTNSVIIKSIQDFTHVNYISPLSKFMGHIERDGNKVITGIYFEQKKSMN